MIGNRTRCHRIIYLSWILVHAIATNGLANAAPRRSDRDLIAQHKKQHEPIDAGASRAIAFRFSFVKRLATGTRIKITERLLAAPTRYIGLGGLLSPSSATQTARTQMSSQRTVVAGICLAIAACVGFVIFGRRLRVREPRRLRVSRRPMKVSKVLIACVLLASATASSDAADIVVAFSTDRPSANDAVSKVARAEREHVPQCRIVIEAMRDGKTFELFLGTDLDTRDP